jgi:hypothetical protein
VARHSAFRVSLLASHRQASFPASHRRASFPASHRRASFPASHRRASFPASHRRASFPASHRGVVAVVTHRRVGDADSSSRSIDSPAFVGWAIKQTKTPHRRQFRKHLTDASPGNSSPTSVRKSLAKTGPRVFRPQEQTKATLFLSLFLSPTAAATTRTSPKNRRNALSQGREPTWRPAVRNRRNVLSHCSRRRTSEISSPRKTDENSSLRGREGRVSTRVLGVSRINAGA